MTHLRAKSKRVSDTLPSFGQLAFLGISLFSLALILRNAQLAMTYMSRGLQLCVTTVIPSLFPFMVLSELLVSSGAARGLGRLLSRPLRALFGIGGEGGCALLLGLFCGFPVGTKCAVSLYRRGALSRGQLSHLLTFCNVPSSAFLINAVGLSLFGERRVGLLLYGVTLLSALLVGLLGRRLFVSDSLVPEPTPPTDPPHGGITLFTDAISSSALSMLSVCAFVVFFTTLSGTMEHLLAALGLSDVVAALLYGILELTGGVAHAASLPAPLSLCLCAFFAGWSGLSVHMQIISLCADTGISFRPYLLAKLAQGLLNLLLVCLLGAAFGLL